MLHHGGSASAVVIARGAVFAAAKRSPVSPYESQMVDDPPYGPYMAEVLTEPHWSTALKATDCAAAGFAAREFIDDERFRTLTGLLVSAIGEPGP